MRRQRTGQSQRRAVSRAFEYAVSRPAVTVFVVAFLVRAAVASVIFVIEGGVIFVDEAMYATMAKVAADGDTANWDSYTRGLYRSTAAFLIPLTLIFKLTPIILVGQLFVASLGAATAALAERLASEVVRRPWSLAAGAVVALMPSQVFFTALTLKDGAVWACGAAIALAVARAGRAEGNRFWWITGATALLLLLMAHLRAHTFVAACWAAGLAIGIGATRLRPRAALVGLGLLLITPLLVGQGIAGLRLVTNHGSLETRRALNAENAATAFVPDEIPDGNSSAARPESGDQSPEGARTTVGEGDVATAGDSGGAGTGGGGGAGTGGGRGGATTGEAGVQAAVEEARVFEKTAAAESERAAALQQAGQAREAEQAQLAAEAARLKAEAARARAERLTRTTTTSGPLLGNPFSEDGDGGSSSAERNLRHLPKGVSAILLEPFPWLNPDNPRVQLARAETLLWYPLIALAAVGVFRLRRHVRVLLFPLLLSGAMVLAYGLTEGNFGTAYRHRGELVWAVAVFAAVGAATLAESRSRRRVTSEPRPEEDPLEAFAAARGHDVAAVQSESGVLSD